MLITVKRALSECKVIDIPEEHRVGWTAGFVEGDGCFYVVNNGSGYKYICIKVDQVNKQPVSTLKKFYGGSLTLKKFYGDSRYIGKPIWRWCVTGRKAVKLGKEIYPLLSDKRKMQLQKALIATGVSLKEVIDNDS